MNYRALDSARRTFVTFAAVCATALAAIAAIAFLARSAAAQSSAEADAALKAELSVVGGTYRIFTQGEPARLRVAAQSVDKQSHEVGVRLWARDIFGKPIAWKQNLRLDLAADGSKAEQLISFPAAPGYFQIGAIFSYGAVSVTKQTDIGVVPPPAAGLRPDSFFASNTSSLRGGDELLLLQKIGMKVQRAHFQPTLGSPIPDQPAGAALPLDFKRQDDLWAEARARDTWVLPIVGYALSGETRSELAKTVGMHGPPRDNAEFVATWEQILRHYPEVTTWEFWNEPWIFGWTWAANGEEYRKLQVQWMQMALRVNPNYRLLAGNSSMFTEDHIEPHPESWKGLLSGTTHHPYSFSTGTKTLRWGDQGRSTDHGMMVTRRMGLPFYYLTEGGTEYRLEPKSALAALPKQLADFNARLKDFPKERQSTIEYLTLQKQATRLTEQLAPYTDPQSTNNNANARKIVQYMVRTALVGAFQGNVQWQIGYGPEWTRSTTTFAVMTHLLEDRPIVAEVWPRHELLWGAVFANPRHVTAAVRSLPRAGELSARWRVPVPAARSNDQTKVAVIWSETGQSNDAIDTTGTLTIDNAGDLKAYDLTGREIKRRGNALTVPFGEYPVYITSDKLSVIELRNRIAKAKVGKVTPLNLYALSLTKPAGENQKLGVRLENQLNRDLRGTLFLRRIGQSKTTSTPFSIAAGKLVEVPIAWPGGPISAQNQYGVALTAKTDAGTVSRRQIVSAARFIKRTIEVDGTLADWRGATPVLLDSVQLESGLDISRYLMNPHLERPTGTPDRKRVVARVYTAYDDTNIYLAAAVNEDKLSSSAGEPVVKGRDADTKITLPYRSGMPEGLNHIRYAGDVWSFAFGFRPRVPGWGRQMDDPWAWKGHFSDTDYHYVAHASTEGPVLMRQWGPSTTRRIAYQTEVVPGYGPVPDAQIQIKRVEAAKLTIYEIAIPRREIALFDASQDRLRFGFLFDTDEQVGGGMQWSQAAGVFDHWLSAGSFGPTWTYVLPCQTFFGIGK